MSTNIENQPFASNAYLSYHQDGLADLFIGIGALLFGLGIVFDLPWIGAIIAAVLAPIWPSVKRAIAAPRLSDDELPPQHAGVRGTILLLTVGLFALGVIVAVLFTADTLPSLRDWLHAYFLLVFGAIIVAALGIVAVFNRVQRYYVYAAVTAAVFVGAYLLNVGLPVAIVLTGAGFVAGGTYLLARFVRTHPVISA
jgi:hypothetical protein